MPKPLIFGHTLTYQNLSGNTGVCYARLLPKDESMLLYTYYRRKKQKYSYATQEESQQTTPVKPGSSTSIRLNPVRSLFFFPSPLFKPFCML